MSHIVLGSLHELHVDELDHRTHSTRRQHDRRTVDVVPDPDPPVRSVAHVQPPVWRLNAAQPTHRCSRSRSPTGVSRYT